MYQIPLLNNNLLKIFYSKQTNNLFDHLYYNLTTTILLLFAIFTSTKQYVGKPIQCWLPMEFKNSWEQYVEDYCFVQNTYYISSNETITYNGSSPQKFHLNYYQWIPIILTLQTLFFYLPNWIWIILKKYTFKVDGILFETSQIQTSSIHERQLIIKKLAKQHNDKILYNEKYSLLIFNGISLTFSYIGIKILCLMNLLAQFYVLILFIGDGYWLWGFQALKTLWNGVKWQNSPLFPLITFCDFNVHQLANEHHYTVQCVLLINMFNEKIYLFIWYWFVVLIFATSFNIIYNIYIFLITPCRWKCKLFKTYGKIPTPHQRITHDGFLILNFIEERIGRCNTKEMIIELQHNLINTNYV